MVLDRAFLIEYRTYVPTRKQSSARTNAKQFKAKKSARDCGRYFREISFGECKRERKRHSFLFFLS